MLSIVAVSGYVPTNRATRSGSVSPLILQTFYFLMVVILTCVLVLVTQSCLTF